MLKIRRPLGRLIFNMGIAIPGKTVFLIETAPRSCYYSLPAKVIISYINVYQPRIIYWVFLYYHNKIWNRVQISRVSLDNIPALVENWISIQYLWTVLRYRFFAWNVHMLERTLAKIVSGKERHIIMMTSSNGNIFRVTGHLCGDFTGHRTKASDAELWCFVWSTPE